LWLYADDSDYCGGQLASQEQHPGEDPQQQLQQMQGGGSGAAVVTHPRNRWRCMQPRVCNYCWKTFSNSFNLKQHIVNVHVESQGVACSVCKKVVKNKWYLRKHLVTAHGAPLKRAKAGGGGAAERNGASDPGALAIMYDGGAEDSEETLNIVE
jgi:hypothetical protein